MLCALCVGQASALEYTMEAPDDYLFGRPTSDDTIYEWEDPNVDRSKNTALIPPGFGTPTSYLPGSGDPLTPNLKVILSGITGTVVVTELESVPGYTIDPDSQSQTVTINPNDTQTIRFYNNAVGGVELIKVSEADKTERIPNTTFEIRRVSDDALVDTVTTGESGSVFVTLEDNNYYAVEIESAEGFKLDSTPHYFTIKNGQTTKLTVTNAPMSGILLHKISTADGKGIPGVSFILYDSGHNPIDQQTTDDRC